MQRQQRSNAYNATFLRALFSPTTPKSLTFTVKDHAPTTLTRGYKLEPSHTRINKGHNAYTLFEAKLYTPYIRPMTPPCAALVQPTGLR